MKKSKIVIDIQHPNQTGLTMRTIEAIGSYTKILTTNHDIINYDFYNPNNVLIIDRNNPQFDNDFFSKPIVPYEKDLYYKYSIEGWIDFLFDNLWSTLFQ